MTDRLSTLQDFPIAAGIQAIKDSLDFDDFDVFYRHLVEDLPQNSPQTRLRYASLVVRWFFPERRLNGFLPRVWQAYRDERLLRDLTRVTTLEVEPVIARFVTGVISPVAVGDTFPVNLARDYVTATYGVFKGQSYQRLLTTCGHLGFLTRSGNSWVIPAISPPADALLLLIHARLAPTPRIVRLADILSTNIWRYLGFRETEQVQAVLRQAELTGLIARYVVVDDLEQITTIHSYADYLAGVYRLAPIR